MIDALVVGVDIGGSHITAAVIDTQKRKLVDGTCVRNKLNAMAGADEIIKCWAATIAACLAHINNRQCAIGIAMPGPFNYEQGISGMKDQNKYDALYALNVRDLLANALHIEPNQIFFSNDAACFLQGELFAGFADNTTAAAGFTLGTGLGSATVCSGKAADANLWCAPFKATIAEDYLSSRWFVKRYETLTGKPIKDVESIAKQTGSATAQQIFTEFGEQLAQFLAPYIQQHQWELVVLGGNITKAYALFAPSLQHTLQSLNATVELQTSSLGEQAALLGAASVCKNYHAA